MRSSGGRKITPPVSLSSFDFESDRSELRYTPDGDADYAGEVICTAENDVGAQRRPCKFRLVMESAPDQLRSCRLSNVTWEVTKMWNVFGQNRRLIWMTTTGGRRMLVILGTQLDHTCRY